MYVKKNAAEEGRKVESYGKFKLAFLLIYMYIYINWSAGISYLHSRACPLIGSILLGFTYCDGSERESYSNITFKCSFIGYFFLGFHIATTGTVSLCLTMIKKKEHQNTRPRVSMLSLSLSLSWSK
jgi:hypothetical protein